MSLAPEAAEAQLFADTLVCTEHLAYQLQAVDEAEAERAARAAERLLRALGQFEAPAADEGEASTTDPALQRIEAKLDLLLEVLGRSPHVDSARARELHWSRHGARIALDAAPAADSLGVLKIEAQSGLPLPLELPVRVLAAAPQAPHGWRVWLAFQHDMPALAAALERLLFRQHRRQIAAQRQR